MPSAKSIKAFFRSLTSVFDHFLNAALAAATASSRSSLVDTGTAGSGFLVAGLMAVLVSFVSLRLPLMMLWKVSKVTAFPVGIVDVEVADSILILVGFLQ